jgi:hypothetical protein
MILNNRFSETGIVVVISYRFFHFRIDPDVIRAEIGLCKAKGFKDAFSEGRDSSIVSIHFGCLFEAA